MKPSSALKPLVFALAALMAVAAQANPPAPPVTYYGYVSGATAGVADAQNSHHNAVINGGTHNNATVNESIKGSEGNVGVNVASGSGNQQDNAVAIATSDENFVFSTATAWTSANQTSSFNGALNVGSTNNALLNNSANGSEGNVGVNIAAGDFNQQKNNLAIAVSGGRVATAGTGASQTSNNLLVVNESSLSLVSSNWYYPVYVSTPVTNNATMNSSFNGISGNGGANIASGVGNQQNNSLSIAAGCKVCM